MKKYFIYLFLITALSAISTAEKNNSLNLKQIINLPGVDGRIDHMSIDINGMRLFVSAFANNSLEIIDLNSGKVIKSIKKLFEPQGVAFIPLYNKIYVANGRNGYCNIYDGNTYQLLNKINFKLDADNIRYDEINHVVYIGYGYGGLAAINPENDKIIFDIKLTGHPESFALEKEGNKIFVNIPEYERSVNIIDRDKKIITGKWVIGDKSTNFYLNFPMDLDEAHHRLFIATLIPSNLKIINSLTGKIIASVKTLNDADDLFYNDKTQEIYLSCGQGYIEIIKEINPDYYKETQRILTSQGARTSLFVKELDEYFLAVPKRSNQRAAICVYKTNNNGN